VTSLAFVNPVEYCHTVWYGKIKTVWLLRVKKIEDKLAVSTEYRRVTDRQTSSDSTARAMHHHAVIIKNKVYTFADFLVRTSEVRVTSAVVALSSTSVHTRVTVKVTHCHTLYTSLSFSSLPSSSFNMVGYVTK